VRTSAVRIIKPSYTRGYLIADDLKHTFLYTFLYGVKVELKGYVETYPRACYERLWESGGATPLILNLGTGWR
jgi:hypothetical protein